MAGSSTSRNINGMTVWVPNEAFEFLQKLWKPEYQWAPVPVDRSLVRAPENIAFIQTGIPDPKEPRTPLRLQAPRISPRTPRTPLPPLETSLKRRSRGIHESPGSAELETAVTAVSAVSSPADTLSPQTPSTATEPESPDTPGHVKLRDLPPPPGQETVSPALKLTGLKYLGNDNREPSQLAWETLDGWREYQHDNEWRGYHRDNDLHPGGWETVSARRAMPMRDNLPPGPWKVEDSRGNYKKKAGTRHAAWQTLGGEKVLDMNESFLSKKTTDTAWHGSQKGFSVKLDMHLNVDVQMRGTVSGDITLSAEALYAL